MKYLIIFFGLVLAGVAQARDLVAVQSPYSASHSGTPAMQKILDQANQSQDRYRFILEFRPGAEQLLAVRALDEQPHARLAIIAPKFVEHVEAGRLNLQDYIPVHALGDACWAVITNVGDAQRGVVSLKGQREITVGGVGFGNAAHLTSLELAEKLGFQVRYVPFRSNFDALVLMASDNSINLVLDRIASYHQFKERNPRLTVLAMNCATRHPDLPHIKTLKEQGISVPQVFNITVAHQSMDPGKRAEVSRILQEATIKIGRSEIQKLSDMHPPVFDRIDLQTYYSNHLVMIRSLLVKHRQHIPQ